MIKATILDYQSLAPTDLNMQSLWQLPIIWTLHDYTNANDTASRLTDQEIILTNKVVLDEQLLRTNSQIKLIIILATGTNNVDLNVAKALNIPVCNIVAYSTESVVQHTFAFILAMQSRLIEYQNAVKKGDWCNSQFFGLLQFPIQEVAGKTLGIIGFGAIGKRIKTVAEALGMKVVIAESVVPNVSGENKSAQYRVTLPELFRLADVISIHCPLSPYSQNLIDADAFAQMKPTALLLNMGRGGIVNEQALANALINKQIRAAAIDVLSQEPPSPHHILLNGEIPNLIITPHTAWASREARQELLDQVVKILHSLSTGKLINQVNIADPIKTSLQVENKMIPNNKLTEHNIDDQFDKLIIDLQTKITFQEDTVQALNDIVTDQQQDILILKSQVKELVEELKGILSGLDNGSVSSQVERPPHY